MKWINRTYNTWYFPRKGGKLQYMVTKGCECNRPRKKWKSTNETREDLHQILQIALRLVCAKRRLCTVHISVSMVERNHAFLLYPFHRKSKSFLLRMFGSFFFFSIAESSSHESTLKNTMGRGSLSNQLVSCKAAEEQAKPLKALPNASPIFMRYCKGWTEYKPNLQLFAWSNCSAADLNPLSHARQPKPLSLLQAKLSHEIAFQVN